MSSANRATIYFALAAASVSLLGASDANAEDFLSGLFGGFGRPAPRADYERPAPLQYAPDISNPNGDIQRRPARPSYAGGGSAYCVRTCDGRYFPAPAADSQSRATGCNSFCPASDTKVFYGSSIDHAVSDSGKSYSSLPNAFKYRNEVVAGCTCNGKDAFGLAQVKIEDDPTLRKGDIVSSGGGLQVSGRSADNKRGASLELSPVSPTIRAQFARPPIVAQN